jgi:hypothetical protein
VVALPKQTNQLALTSAHITKYVKAITFTRPAAAAPCQQQPSEVVSIGLRPFHLRNHPRHATNLFHAIAHFRRIRPFSLDSTPTVAPVGPERLGADE